MTTLKQFKVREGKHHVRNKTKGIVEVYKPGDVVYSEDDLDKKFIEKFERVTVDAPAPAAAVVPVPIPEPETEIPLEEDGDEAPTDVTASFPEATVAGLQVLKSPSGTYSVVNGEEVLNAAPLENRKSTVQFIKAWIKKNSE